MTEVAEPKAKTVYLIAGEPSGDELGARLIAGLRAEAGEPIEIWGVGGPAMEAAGLKSLFPMHELSVMGVAEVLPRLALILRRIRETAQDILAKRPDALVTIDSPDFCLRVARKIKGAGIPAIHYVAPSVWAWRPGRAQSMAAYLDHVLALLPFEPPWFERCGLACTFVGHPVVEGAAKSADGPGFRQRAGITPDTPVLAALPGSRRSEVTRLLPVFRQTVQRLAAKTPTLEIVMATVEPLAADLAKAVENWPRPVRLITDREEKFHAFAAADAALAASGTVSLELAMTRTPTVIAYKMNPITSLLARRVIRVPYVNLINLILDKPIVPERLLGECRPDVLADDLTKLLDDQNARQRQMQAFEAALDELGRGDDSPPSHRAARTVLDVISGQKT